MVLEQCWVGYYPSYNNAYSGIFLPRTRWTWVFSTLEQRGLGCGKDEGERGATLH